MPRYEAVQVHRAWCLNCGLPDEREWYRLSQCKCQMIDAPITQLTFRSNCQRPMGYANYCRSTSRLERANGLHRFTHDARLPQRPDILVRRPRILKKNEFDEVVYVYNYLATPGGRDIKVCEVHSYAMEKLIWNGEITKQAIMVICQPTTWRALSAQKVLWQTKALIRRDQPNLHAVLARNVRARHE